MATATRKAPAKEASAKKDKGTLDYLELALENLNKARDQRRHARPGS